MTRPILAVLVLAISIPPLYAQGTILQTDRSGYTTGIDGNRTVNTYTDRYGNTTGWIGGKYISTYGDGYGVLDGRSRQRRLAGLARLVAQQPVDALRHEPLLPSPHHRLRFAR